MKSNFSSKWFWGLWSFFALLLMMVALWINIIIITMAMLLSFLSLCIAVLMIQVAQRSSKFERYSLFTLSSIGVTLTNVLFLILALSYREYHIPFSPPFVSWFILGLSVWYYFRYRRGTNEN